MSLNKQLDKYLKDKLQNYKFKTGIAVGKNSRRTVLHTKNSKVFTSRGIANRKATKASKTTNSDVFVNLYESGFNFYSRSFTQSNPNYETFLNSINYILDADPRRLENAITANVKAYLDKQRTFKNKESTIDYKGFDKFGIDSRQFQLSLDTTSEKPT